MTTVEYTRSDTVAASSIALGAGSIQAGRAASATISGPGRPNRIPGMPKRRSRQGTDGGSSWAGRSGSFTSRGTIGPRTGRRRRQSNVGLYAESESPVTINNSWERIDFMKYIRPAAIGVSAIAIAAAPALVATSAQAQEMNADQITADTSAATSAELIIPLILLALLAAALSSGGGSGGREA